MSIEACPVCEEPLLPPNLADCHSCSRIFHLQVRMDVAGKDCGDVWIQEERMHLVFGCRVCLDAGLFPERLP